MKRSVVLGAVLALFLAVTFLLTVSIPVAHATPPMTISGQILVTGYTIYDTRYAGESDNVFVSLSLRGRFTGGISGSYTSESCWIRHNAGLPDVWTIVHGVDFISPATVMGKTGTLDFMLNGKSAEGGNWVIIGGTGDLANLHGQGTYSPAGGAVVNYEGQVHFDP